MYPKFPLAFVLLGALPAHATTGSATVVVLRGSAQTGAGQPLKEQQKVEPGTTVVTASRSFVRLLFADNTQLNVGPDTTMKIEATKPGEASLVDLVGGQIRAKVTKDPLAHPAGTEPKEKMVVKTVTAAMGIRGTDFNVSFNPQNQTTALVTFEGNVAMARLNAGESPLRALHQSVGVQSVGAGQFSGVQPSLTQASVPVKISPAQLESLKGNVEFRGLGEKTEKPTALASPVPPGVDPKSFATHAESRPRETAAKVPPEGFYRPATGEYAPRAGGYVDLASGRYIPPPAGSSFDSNTGVFVPPLALGTVNANGMYVPPKGVDLDPVKGFVPEAKPATAGADARGPSAATASGNLILAMNDGVKPENNTRVVTLDGSLSAGGALATGQFDRALPPPPPPPGNLPPPPIGTDPLRDRPVSGNCADDHTCGGTNPTAPPASGLVNFRVNVTD